MFVCRFAGEGGMTSPPISLEAQVGWPGRELLSAAAGQFSWR